MRYYFDKKDKSPNLFMSKLNKRFHLYFIKIKEIDEESEEANQENKYDILKKMKDFLKDFESS